MSENAIVDRLNCHFHIILRCIILVHWAGLTRVFIRSDILVCVAKALEVISSEIRVIVDN